MSNRLNPLPPPPPSDAQLVPTKSEEIVEELKDIASNDDTDKGAETARSISADKLTKVKSFVVSRIAIPQLVFKTTIREN